MKNSDEVPAAVSRRSHLTTSVTAPVAAAVGAKGLVAVAQDLAARSAGDVVVLDRVTRHVNDFVCGGRGPGDRGVLLDPHADQVRLVGEREAHGEGPRPRQFSCGTSRASASSWTRASADRRGGGLRAVLPRFTSFGDVALRAGSDGSEGLRAGAEAQRLPVAPRDDRAHLVPVTAVRDPGANKGHGRRRHPRDGGAPGYKARGGVGMNLAAASCHLLNRPETTSAISARSARLDPASAGECNEMWRRGGPKLGPTA